MAISTKLQKEDVIKQAIQTPTNHSSWRYKSQELWEEIQACANILLGKVGRWKSPGKIVAITPPFNYESAKKKWESHYKDVFVHEEQQYQWLKTYTSKVIYKNPSRYVKAK